jgi:hypothetical protein
MGFLGKRLDTKMKMIFFLLLPACTHFSKPSHQWYSFPADAFVEMPSRPYKRVGMVRAKVNFRSFDEVNDEKTLCSNYYNQAVADLVRMAKEKKADAVMLVRSVVFLGSGIQETYVTPECADDGAEGQILTQAVAIQWTGQ